MEHLCSGLLLFLFLQVVTGGPLFTSTNSERIVGGKIAPEGRFPYMVSLRLDNHHFCGASILSSEWIITAAHCILGFSPISVVAVVGTNKINQGGDAYTATELVIHEKYESHILGYDIGLVQVPSILFTEKIQPVSVYNKYMPENIDVHIVGWGRLGLSEEEPNDLQFFESENICNRIFKIGQGACFGDSGGPVVATNTDDEDLLAGLVSWGKPCAEGYPDVHTRVYSYIVWIKENCHDCFNIA